MKERTEEKIIGALLFIGGIIVMVSSFGLPQTIPASLTVAVRVVSILIGFVGVLFSLERGWKKFADLLARIKDEYFDPPWKWPNWPH